MLNADDETIAKYCEANETNATEETKAAVSYFNQERPLQKVTVLKNAETAPADAVRYAYYNMFIHLIVPPLALILLKSSLPAIVRAERIMVIYFVRALARLALLIKPSLKRSP